MEKQLALSQLLTTLKASNYYFTTISPATHERVNRRTENLHSRTLMDVFGWNRLFDRSLLPHELLERLLANDVVVEESNGFRSAIRASSVGDDLLLHSSFPTLSADAVFFGPDSYRFARLIKQHFALTQHPVQRCLDIGCGTGVGGMLVARHWTTCDVHFTDINDVALELARINSSFAGLSRCRFIKSDLYERIEGKFDLIVSNPPYLNDSLARKYRHGGGELGSELSIKIAEQSIARLSPGGTLLLYTGSPIVKGIDAFVRSIKSTLSRTAFNWSYEEVDPDVFGEELDMPLYANADRIAAVALTVQNTEK